MKDWITETDRDNLCDMLWWLKGYKKGADDNFESCPFQEKHLDTLDNIVRGMREQLNNKAATDDAERLWEVTMMELVGEDGIGSVRSAINLIKAQRDQAWKDNKEIRSIIEADENESTVDEVRKLWGLGIRYDKIIIRVAGDKIYSNIPFHKFDADIIESPNHEALEKEFGKSII